MKMKVICKLMINDDYEDYQVYPISVTSADTDKDAILNYCETLPIAVEVKSIAIMQASINGDTINFYRIEAKNITVNTTWSTDYMIIDCNLI